MRKDKKLPYVRVLVNGKEEIWPYPEAQEFTIYEFPKEDIIYLTDKEYKKMEEEINERNICTL